MQLNLTDYEAQLLEQRLRGRTVSFSDADHLMITGIADRLLAGEVHHRPTRIKASDGNTYVGAPEDKASWLFTTGDPDPIKALGNRRFYVMDVDAQPPVVQAMSKCNKCSAQYPSAPAGTIHKCGNCSGGMCSPTTHNIRRETDEYACSCGARWDVSEEHP
jgi:hypothetical protein